MRRVLFIFLLVISVNLAAQSSYPVSDITGIESDIAFQGYDEDQAYVGYGEYQIFYSADGILDMPLIITDGYDPGDTSPIDNIYQYMTTEQGVNMFDNLRNQGVDIVILNFPDYTRQDGTLIHGGADYIGRNAYVLIALLQDIQEQMQGNQSFMLIGPSMGGLITRYALTYMEQNGMAHQAGLWLSFDSPHFGANIPISLQYLVNYMAIKGNDPDIIALRDERLNTPASMQMLLDHYQSHLLAGEDLEQDYNIQLPTPAVVYRENFVAELEDLGFPQQTRNLSLINGSNSAIPVESPGTTIVDTELDLGSGAGLEMQLYFTPAAGVDNYVVDHLQPTIYGIDYGDPYYTYAASPSTSAGLDSAPGGTVLMDDFFSNTDSDVMDQFYQALQIESFSFIPALSALGVSVEDWYTPLNSFDVANTPFDAVYTQTENQRHLTLTDEGYDFAYQEALNHFNITGIHEDKIQFIELVQNPVHDNINFSLKGVAFDSIRVDVYTLEGKHLQGGEYINPSGELEIPAPYNKGVYITRLTTGNRTVHFKIIVE